MGQDNKKENQLTEIPKEFKLADLPEGPELFVRQYLTNGYNAADAGRTIGIDYGPSYLKTKNVQTELRRQLKFVFKRLEVAKNRVLEELAAIAFFDIGDVLNDDGTPKRISEIPEHARRAIAGLEIKELFQRDGKKLELIGHLKKFNIESKTKALEILCKHLALFDDKIKVEHTGSVEVVKVEKFDIESRVKQLIESQLADALQ